jgi:hypothetical protein
MVGFFLELLRNAPRTKEATLFYKNIMPIYPSLFVLFTIVPTMRSVLLLRLYEPSPVGFLSTVVQLSGGFYLFSPALMSNDIINSYWSHPSVIILHLFVSQLDDWEDTRNKKLHTRRIAEK